MFYYSDISYFFCILQLVEQQLFIYTRQPESKIEHGLTSAVFPCSFTSLSSFCILALAVSKFFIFKSIEGKMIGLVGVSGGTLGATHALSSLHTVGRALHAWVIPEQASIPEAWKVFDEKGTLKDSKLEKRLKEVG
jgi:hypothetical protein